MTDVVIVAGITAVTAAIAVPAMSAAMRTSGLDGAVQNVATTVRTARYQAVTRNRTLRVRFNCPAANQLRVIEVTGDPNIDNAANRCDPAAFPYPDPDPAVLPNNDGPVVTLSAEAEFGALPDIQITPAGRMLPLNNCPNCVVMAPPATLVVRNRHEQKQVVVAPSGQVSVSTGWYVRAY